MATVALLANGTPHPTSTRLQPPSSLAAHRDGCTTVWVGPPQKAVGGQERSNAWCVERCSQDQLSDCPTDLCQCKEEQRATRQRNSHRSSNPIPRQCEQFIASSTAQQQPWAWLHSCGPTLVSISESCIYWNSSLNQWAKTASCFLANGDCATYPSALLLRWAFKSRTRS